MPLPPLSPRFRRDSTASHRFKAKLSGSSLIGEKLDKKAVGVAACAKKLTAHLREIMNKVSQRCLIPFKNFGYCQLTPINLWFFYDQYTYLSQMQWNRILPRYWRTQLPCSEMQDMFWNHVFTESSICAIPVVASCCIVYGRSGGSCISLGN